MDAIRCVSACVCECVFVVCWVWISKLPCSFKTEKMVALKERNVNKNIQSKATAAKANKTFTTCKWKISRFFSSHFRGVHSTRLIKQSMLIYVFVINSFSNSQFFFLSISAVCECVYVCFCKCAHRILFSIRLFLSLFGVLCASRMLELYAFAIVTLWNAFTKTLRSLSTERENAMRKADTVLNCTRFSRDLFFSPSLTAPHI